MKIIYSYTYYVSTRRIKKLLQCKTSAFFNFFPPVRFMLSECINKITLNKYNIVNTPIRISILFECLVLSFLLIWKVINICNSVLK